MIDWQEIHDRLAKIREIQDLGWVVDGYEKKRILAERARNLAYVPTIPAAAGTRIQFLEFTLTRAAGASSVGETYGIETSYIREVVPARALTPVPGTPTFIGGIVTLRAQILVVVDLRPLFDLPRGNSDHLDRVIVLGAEDGQVGFLAAQILGVRELPAGDLEPSLPTLTGMRAKYLKGISKSRTAVLDAGKLLADQDIIVQAGAEATSSN